MAFIKGDLSPIMKYLRPHKKAIRATALIAVLEMAINLSLPTDELLNRVIIRN